MKESILRTGQVGERRRWKEGCKNLGGNKTGCTSSGNSSEMGIHGQSGRCCLQTPTKEKAMNIA